MTEIKRNLLVLFSEMPPEQAEICQKCSNLRHLMGSDDFCRAAALERDFGTALTYNLARSRSIDVDGIPDKCPNGYIAMGSRQMIDTK